MKIRFCILVSAIIAVSACGTTKNISDLAYQDDLYSASGRPSSALAKSDKAETDSLVDATRKTMSLVDEQEEELAKDAAKIYKEMKVGNTTIQVPENATVNIYNNYDPWGWDYGFASYRWYHDPWYFGPYHHSWYSPFYWHSAWFY
ncbi:MAG: hypothetical protein KBT05_04470, partial [Bacteroidales bacterium]|nr:hypothetical protein [Candidatus Cryptobacteroides caccocaballi]